MNSSTHSGSMSIFHILKAYLLLFIAINKSYNNFKLKLKIFASLVLIFWYLIGKFIKLQKYLNKGCCDSELLLSKKSSCILGDTNPLILSI